MREENEKEGELLHPYGFGLERGGKGKGESYKGAYMVLLTSSPTPWNSYVALRAGYFGPILLGEDPRSLVVAIWALAIFMENQPVKPRISRLMGFPGIIVGSKSISCYEPL